MIHRLTQIEFSMIHIVQIITQFYFLMVWLRGSSRPSFLQTGPSPFLPRRIVCLYLPRKRVGVPLCHHRPKGCPSMRSNSLIPGGGLSRRCPQPANRRAGRSSSLEKPSMLRSSKIIVDRLTLCASASSKLGGCSFFLDALQHVQNLAYLL